MANKTHKMTKTEKVTLKGIISDDATIIEVDGEEVVTQDYIAKFAGDYLEITMTNKEEKDMLVDEE